MAPLSCKTPKSEVNDWCLFHTNGAHRPIYVTEGGGEKGPTYRCTLTLPDGRKFEGGPGHSKKKDAEQDAAERAMQAIGRAIPKEVPASPTSAEEESPASKWQLLKSRIEAAFSDKSVVHASPLSPFFQTAAKTGIAIPLAVVAQIDNRIVSALRGVDPRAERDPPFALSLLTAAVRECEGVHLAEDGLGVLRSRPWPESLRLQAASEHASYPSECFRAVFLPRNLEQLPVEVMLPKGGGSAYLEGITKALGLEDPTRVLISRVIGKSGSTLRLYSALLPIPSVAVQSDGSVSLSERPSFERNKRNEQNERSRESAAGFKEREEEGHELRADNSEQHERSRLNKRADISECQRMNILNDPIEGADVSNGHEMSSLHVPANVSKGQETKDLSGGADINERNTTSNWSERNERASWVAGHPVLGDAIVACVGTTYQSLGKLTWSDVTVEEWHNLLLSRTPRGMYQLNRGAPLAATLPRAYPGTDWWEGKSPKTLLFDLVKPKCSGADGFEPVYSVTEKETKLPEISSGWEAEVEFVYGYQTMRASSGEARASQADAENASALAGLHLVQALYDSRVLTKHAAKEEAELGACSHTESEGTAITDYSITFGVVLEENRGFKVPRGTGAVIPQLEESLETCSQGEVRRFTLPALSSWLPLIATKTGALIAPDLTVEVRLCGHVEPREQRLEGALFTPSLATQRMDFALQLGEQCKAASVLDLGCGSGAFLDTVVERSNCVRKLAGVDISERALQKAQKSVKQKWEKRAANEPMMLASADDVEIIEGSMLDLEERFNGVDLATCIEVVEHLDPEPLEAFGEAILGRLRPKVLLVSSPNIEYNPLLQAAATSSDVNTLKEATCQTVIAPKLRNEDHRFEWTRAEFRAWAHKLGDAYGYSVEFAGVGGNGDESGPGFCTQIATFRDQKAS